MLYFILILNILPLNVSAYSAKSSIVMDIDSGRILYNNNKDDRRLIASITKIMTCIVVLENENIEKEVVVGDEVRSMYGTNIYLETGEKIRIKDLLYGLMLRSGNDAAITLAVNTLGYDVFVAKMNECAIKIGMKNTFFENPHGLDDDTKNYSSAYDMALLARYAYKNKIYRQIISTKKYVAKSSIKSYVWYNRMSLLSKYKNCVGGKNGYTPKAGKTLVSYAEKENMKLLIVSLNDSDIYSNHHEMYKVYFEKYKNYIIVDKKTFNMFPIDKKKELYYVKKSFKYPLLESELNQVKILAKISSEKTEGCVGKLIIKLNNEKIGDLNIYKKSSKKKKDKSFLNRLVNLFIGKSIEINRWPAK